MSLHNHASSARKHYGVQTIVHDIGVIVLRELSQTDGVDLATQITDGLEAVLSDIELRARVYSQPLLPKADKFVPRPDKAVWKHLTVRASCARVATSLHPAMTLVVERDRRLC